jgi:hypothetical protein
VLPQDCRANVSNNDVGNPHGDMYFNLKDKYLPVACAWCNEQSDPRKCMRNPATFDCTNPESTGNLVVRQISVEVNGFGNNYKLCDVWPGNPACQYTCFGHKHITPTPGVGKEDVCTGSACEMAPLPSKLFGTDHAWDYWNSNVAARFGQAGSGEWYSLTDEDEGTYWRNPKILKTINQKCHSRGVDELVQGRGSSCFDRCEQPTNQSSPCWVSCFFEIVLGPDSNSTRKPPGSQAGALDMEELTAAWLKGFNDTDHGGCPACPPSGPCPDPGSVSGGGGATAQAAPRPAWGARRAPRMAYARAGL